MAIPHALPGQVVDVLPRGASPAGSGGSASDVTVALFKASDLEVMRLVLQRGKSLPPHKVPGEITIHCLEGSMSVSFDGTAAELRAGQLLYLEGNALHGVVALEDTTALVTIALVK